MIEVNAAFDIVQALIPMTQSFALPFRTKPTPLPRLELDLSPFLVENDVAEELPPTVKSVYMQDLDIIIDDIDLIALYNEFKDKKDPRHFLVHDAITYPDQCRIERKMAYDIVRRRKLTSGFYGKTATALNQAAGELRRISQRWFENRRSSKVIVNGS